MLVGRVTSYINNLHPMKEKRIYQLIEKLIDAFIRLWNATLRGISFESDESPTTK
jgi:hypothetical protein